MADSNYLFADVFPVAKNDQTKCDTAPMKANMGEYDFEAPNSQILMPFDNDPHTIEDCNYYCKRNNIGVNLGCDPTK